VTVLARVQAPATTANIGPGFDCAAVALDLWDRLEVSEGEGGADGEHLGVRAFGRITSPQGRRLTFTDRIPQRRGLGSSAAVIALGLVAACVVDGREPEPESLLAEGVELEGHADNLAAALAGGVCLTWGGRIARVAERLPAVPIVVVPEATVATVEARADLPAAVPHADAAHGVAQAALLGAAFASGDEGLFAAALDDRLHEPYRAKNAPILATVRARPPEGSLGATLSGSGPSVVVWARTEDAESCAKEIAGRFPDAQVLRLAVSPTGAVAA
jgi:homoserine kinase